jgi:hypothetical protein
MDVFDIFAFAVFAVLIAAAVTVIVDLGSLPGAIARKRGHPQAAAVNVASWLGLATLGILWPLALIWAFWRPNAASAALNQEPLQDSDNSTPLGKMQARVEALEAALRQIQPERESRS